MDRMNESFEHGWEYKALFLNDVWSVDKMDADQE